MSPPPPRSDLADVNGLRIAYEVRGDEGTPLVLLHGGYGTTASVAHLADPLSQHRTVISADLQGHGRTADIDRPLSFHSLGDDIAALARHLGHERVDVMGYSLGGSSSLRCAIQHPDLVRKLVVVSSPFGSGGWYPELFEQMQSMDRRGFEMMQHTPLFADYAAVAPDPEGFPALMDKMGALLGTPYDWRDEVTASTVPTLLVFGDADSIPPTHAAEFFALLGGGRSDGSWDRSGVPASRLAVLPDTTHYDILASPLLVPVVTAFLDA